MTQMVRRRTGSYEFQSAGGSNPSCGPLAGGHGERENHIPG